jgi:hypothetical protein
MVEVVPSGEAGNARVDHVEVSRDAALFSMIRDRMPMAPGPMARLFVNGGLMMSDGEHEKRTNSEAVRLAHGDVLVAGLGIGMVLVPMLQKPEVRTVLVLEKSAGVIQLVEVAVRRYVGEAAVKLTVVEADAFTWEAPTGRCWDCIYFDVWPDICTDNLKGVTKLKRRYARRLNRDNPKSWMRAWMEESLRSRLRREKRREREYGRFWE